MLNNNYIAQACACFFIKTYLSIKLIYPTKSAIDTVVLIQVYWKQTHFK